ncbi:MAG: hypothetical protein P1V36_01870, partial [Planctomycetota bacterium]|nr:hypothetical protein [Planctomycetota bacterium]
MLREYASDDEDEDGEGEPDTEYDHEQLDDGDPPADEEKAKCCCKFTRVRLTIESFDLGKGKPGQVHLAYSLIHLATTMTWKPGESNQPAPCDVLWEERTNSTFHVPGRRNGRSVRLTRKARDAGLAEIPVPAGPDGGDGKPTQTPEWVDAGPWMKHWLGKAPRGGEMPSFDTLMKAKDCPPRQRWRTVDQPKASKDHFPRTLLIKITLRNGKPCPLDTVLKVSQEIDKDGKVTTDPEAGSSLIPVGSEMPDPAGWEPTASERAEAARADAAKSEAEKKKSDHKKKG